MYNSCYLCQRKNAAGCTLKIADLPVFRLTSGLTPFTHMRVEYFGPIEVTIFRRTVKRWVVLFTCLATRCVHMEMAYSLDTSLFISTLGQFQNRCGVAAASCTSQRQRDEFRRCPATVSRMPQRLKSVRNHNSPLSEADKMVFKPTSSASFCWRVGEDGPSGEGNTFLRVGASMFDG